MHWLTLSPCCSYISGVAHGLCGGGKAGKGKGNGASNPSAEIFKKEVKIC